MDKRKIIFGVSVLVIGSAVAYYFYNDKKKNKKSLELTPIDATPIGATSTPLKPFVEKKAPVYRTESDANMEIATAFADRIQNHNPRNGTSSVFI